MFFHQIPTMLFKQQLLSNPASVQRASPQGLCPYCLVLSSSGGKNPQSCSDFDCMFLKSFAWEGTRERQRWAWRTAAASATSVTWRGRSWGLQLDGPAPGCLSCSRSGSGRLVRTVRMRDGPAGPPVPPLSWVKAARTAAVCVSFCSK